MFLGEGGGRRHAAAAAAASGAGTQAGSEWEGGRFLCLKYCTTCWGSSASTALAKVSFAACRVEGGGFGEERTGVTEKL